MFIGSVPQPARLLVLDILKKVPKNTPIYVGCSGNFTIDRIAASLGFKVYSNDVALYSKLIADIVLKKNTDMSVRDESFERIFADWPESPFKRLV